MIGLVKNESIRSGDMVGDIDWKSLLGAQISIVTIRIVYLAPESPRRRMKHFNEHGPSKLEAKYLV